MHPPPRTATLPTSTHALPTKTHRVQGVTYKVERQLVPQGPFSFLINAKGREFVDETIPPGAAQVTYRVTAQTSTKDGPAGGFTVRFGAGNQVVSTTEDTTSGKEAG